MLIYGLVDPRDYRIRYIGKSTNPTRRLRRHLKEARDGQNHHRARWIAAMLRDGVAPVIEIIEQCTTETWQARERYWIAKMRRLGAKLTNIADGGEGLVPTVETRAKMSAAKRGRPALNRGVSPSDETRARQRAAALARFARMTPLERLAATAHLRPFSGRKNCGWHHTPEARRKIAEANRRR